MQEISLVVESGVVFGDAHPAGFMHFMVASITQCSQLFRENSPPSLGKGKSLG
jgi:hypothetical protein